MDVFNEKMLSYIDKLDVKKRAKYTIKNNTYLDILKVLESETSDVSPKFKFWARQTFRLIQIGSSNLVYTIKTDLPLVTHENLFEKIAEYHIAVGHSGRDKTWAEVKRRYAGIPQQAVSIYINMCDACQVRRSVPKPVSGKPIVSVGFLTRIQVDLIDMRSLEHDGFNFIMHVKDHFTKFSWLFPLLSKEAKNVAVHLRNIFYTFGPPKILQSDNGKEFVAQIILDLKINWPDLVIVNGRPRHPQSQGLVERSNAVVQKMLGKWQETNKTTDWPSGLGPVMLAMNSSVSQSTQKTPYEMVFGQSPRNNHDFWLELHKQSSSNSIINEEDIPQSIVENINFVDESTTVPSSTYSDNDLLNPVLPSTTCATAIADNITYTSHKRIRDEGEKCYIRTAERQLQNYQRSLKKQKIFQMDDIVGLKIADVDRSNTAPSILPCKVVRIFMKEETFKTSYTVASLHGIITDSFLSTDFIDLSETVSAELRQMDASVLPTITFIQASQMFTHYKATDVCKCMGSCDTNRCPCKKRLVKCCSKCHRGKCISCKNNI